MSEHAGLRHPDPEAHEPGCLHFGGDMPLSDPGAAYIDVFCDCHRYTEPRVLSNGTDIAWPAGWQVEQAHQWRRDHRLAPPAQLYADDV